MSSIEWICTGGPYGDETSGYKGRINKEITIEDFIKNEINKEEWGTVYINGNSIFDYSRQGYSEIRKDLLDKYKTFKIKKVTAHGGWSRMDYYLFVEEEKEKEDLNPLHLTFNDGYNF